MAAIRASALLAESHLLRSRLRWMSRRIMRSQRRRTLRLLSRSCRARLQGQGLVPGSKVALLPRYVHRSVVLLPHGRLPRIRKFACCHCGLAVSARTASRLAATCTALASVGLARCTTTHRVVCRARSAQIVICAHRVLQRRGRGGTRPQERPMWRRRQWPPLQRPRRRSCPGCSHSGAGLRP